MSYSRCEVNSLYQTYQQCIWNFCVLPEERFAREDVDAILQTGVPGTTPKCKLNLLHFKCERDTKPTIRRPAPEFRLNHKSNLHFGKRKHKL
jgi:hypothetical protein